MHSNERIAADLKKMLTNPEGEALIDVLLKRLNEAGCGKPLGPAPPDPAPSRERCGGDGYIRWSDHHPADPCPGCPDCPAPPDSGEEKATLDEGARKAQDELDAIADKRTTPRAARERRHRRELQAALARAIKAEEGEARVQRTLDEAQGDLKRFLCQWDLWDHKNDKYDRAKLHSLCKAHSKLEKLKKAIQDFLKAEADYVTAALSGYASINYYRERRDIALSSLNKLLKEM